MSIRPILASCAAAALALGISLGMVACGATRQERYTYVKKDASETRMLADKEELKRTSGVKQVIATIDAQNAITLQLFVDEDDSKKGLEKVLDLGYSQVRN